MVGTLHLEQGKSLKRKEQQRRKYYKPITTPHSSETREGGGRVGSEVEPRKKQGSWGKLV